MFFEYFVFLLFSAWLEASFQDELDPGNAQHEEHARNLVVTLVQQLEAKALESGDFLTKNKLEEITASIKVRLKLIKQNCGVSRFKMQFSGGVLESKTA